MIEPLRLEISLDCGRDHAFATWVERFGRWWPRAHSVSGDPAEIVLEPMLGGRIYERNANHAGWDGLLPHFAAACGPIGLRSRTNKEPAP